MSSQKTAQFTSFEESTKEDWQIIAKEYIKHSKGLADRVLEHLKLLDGDYGGFPIDRLTHSLQTATLAHANGEDEEYVVCALLHDMGDTLSPYDHGALVATMLKPFISEANYWMIEHHTTFQGYYYFHYLGKDRNARDQYKDSPHYDYTIRFCDLYDNKAFNPELETKPLEFFEPMVRRILAKPKNNSMLDDVELEA